MQTQIIYLYMPEGTPQANVMSTTRKTVATKKPGILYGAKTYLALVFVNSSGGADDVDLSSIVSWYFCIDDDYDTSSSVLIEATDDIVVSTRTIDSVDYTQVLIPITEPATEELETALSAATAQSNGYISVTAELAGFESDETDPAFAVQFSMFIYARVGSPGTGSPTSVADNALTAAQVQALVDADLNKDFSTYDTKETVVVDDSIAINNSEDDGSPARALFSALWTLFKSLMISEGLGGVTYKELTLTAGGSTTLTLGTNNRYLVDFWIRDSSGYYYEGMCSVVNTGSSTADLIDKGHAISSTALTEFNPDGDVGSITAVNSSGTLGLKFTLASGTDRTLNYSIFGATSSSDADDDSDDDSGDTTEEKYFLIGGYYADYTFASGTDLENLTAGGAQLFDQGTYIYWDGSRLHAGGALSDGNVTDVYAYSDDEGATWTAVNCIVDNLIYGIIAIGDGRLLASGYGSEYSVAYSDDNGETWTGCCSSSLLAFAIKPCYTSTGRIVMPGYGASDTIAYSDDNGETWTGLGNSIIDSMGYVVYDADDYLLFGGQGTTNTLAYSDDNGETWTGLGNSIFDSLCSCFSGNADNSVIVAGGVGTTNTLAYSTDKGLTWTGLGNSIIDTTSGVSQIIHDGTKFIAVASGCTTYNIATSIDGINWTTYSDTTLTSDSTLSDIMGICSKNQI